MGVWRVAVDLTGPSLPNGGVNIWHIRTGQEVGDVTYEQAIGDAMDALHDFYEAAKVTYAAGTSINWDGQAQEIDTDAPRVVSGQTPWGVSGTGDMGMPAANAMIVQWRSALATRRGRGRTFIGPVKQSAGEANGTPEEPSRTSLLAAAQALVDSSSSVNAPPWAFGVWSPTDKVIRDFTGCAVPNKFAVLRSRRD
jgi:hypothetical protein